MNKILIELRDGKVEGVFTTEHDTQIVIVDHNEVDLGRTPVGDVYEQDGIFDEGEAHLLFSADQTDAPMIEISQELKRIKF